MWHNNLNFQIKLLTLTISLSTVYFLEINIVKYLKIPVLERAWGEFQGQKGPQNGKKWGSKKNPKMCAFGFFSKASGIQMCSKAGHRLSPTWLI